MSTKYSVTVGPYAERHYLKNFSKKYKGAWEITWSAVVEEFRRCDSLFGTSIAEIIVDAGSIIIAKTEFRVAGTKESRKASGNRCIIALHKDIMTVNVLLVYHKTDLGDGNETVRWKLCVKENYSEYCGLL